MSYVMQTGKNYDADGLISFKNIINIGKERIPSTIKASDKDKAKDLANRIEEKIREKYSKQINTIMTGKNFDSELLEVKEAFSDLCKNVDSYMNLYKNDTLNKNSTLRDVFEFWKINTKSKKITIDRHEGNFSHVAFKNMIDRPIKEITHWDIVNFLATVRNPKNNREKSREKKVAEGTVRKYFLTLTMLINYAADCRIIEKPYTEKEFRQLTPQDDSPEAKFLTEDELDILVDIILTSDPRKLKRMYRISVLIAIFTGCRVGEIGGLTWKDIDEKECFIYINKASGYEKGIGTVIGETKTKNSKRPVHVPKEIMDEIMIYQQEEIEKRKLKGYDYSKNSFVFINHQTGKLLCPSSISRNFKEFLNESEQIETITFHGLRHSNITMLLRNGMNLDDVSKGAGHCNTLITSRTYSHIINKDRKKGTIITSKLLKNKDAEPSIVGTMN